MIDQNRLLAITDGIVATAATIMVLQLVVPKEVSMDAVAEQWPTLVAYIISFAGYLLAAASTFVNPFLAYIIILALSFVEILLMCLYDIKIGKQIKKEEKQ